MASDADAASFCVMAFSFCQYLNYKLVQDISHDSRTQTIFVMRPTFCALTLILHQKTIRSQAFFRNMRLNSRISERQAQSALPIIVRSIFHDITTAQLASSKRYASEQPAQDRADYAAAEDKAKGERIGLWSDAQPTAPWGWRKK